MTIPGLRFILMLAGFTLLAFRDPIWAMASVLFEYHNHPDLSWWGESLPDLRWTLIVSLIAIGAFFLHWGRYEHLPKLKLKHLLILFALLVVMHLRPGIINPTQHWKWAEKDLKNLLFAIVLGATMSTPGRYRLILWVLVTGAFTFGLEATFSAHREGGRLKGVGGPDSSSDNYLAAQLAWAVPFLINFMVRGKRWERLAALAIGPFVLNAIVLTGSRGGLVALVVGALVYLSHAVRRKESRRQALVILLAGTAVFAYLMDDPFRTRAQTLIEQEGSEEFGFTGTGRTLIWAGGARMVRDHPLGLGGGGFRALSPRYLDPSVLPGGGGGRTAHSAYLTCAADYGLQALALWVWLLFVMARIFVKTRREQEQLEAPSPLTGDAQAALAAFFAMLTSSAIANQLHSDYSFWMIAMATGLVHSSTWVKERMEEGDDGLQAIRRDAETVDNIPLRGAALFLLFSIAILYAVGGL